MSRPQTPDSRTSKASQKEHEFTRLSRWWVLETGTVHQDEEDVEQEESYEEENTKSTKLPFLVLHPYSRYRIAWDLLVMLLLLENMIMVPFVLCFEESQPQKRWSTANDISTWFHFASDCLFMVDIILNFCTSFPKIDERGEEVMVTSRKKIAWKYMTTWFVLDLIGSVPIEFILSALGLLDSNGSSMTRFLKFFKLMRLVKLARIWRFERFIRKLREAFDFNPAIIRAVKMAAFFCLLAHALSCLLFWIGIGWVQDFQTCQNETYVEGLGSEPCLCQVGEGAENNPLKNCKAETWVTENYFMVPHRGSQAVQDLTIGDQYLITLYWIMSTMTTVGFGDLKPYTQYEIWTCILAQILGATTFGFIVGNMASLAELLRGRAGAFKEKMEFLVRFMNHCNIPTEVQKRVTSDLKHQMLRPVALIKRDIIDKVPAALGIDLAKSTYHEVLEMCPLFDGIAPTTRNSLYRCLRPTHVAPGECIARRGELSSSIIFILTGGLHVVSDDDEPKKEAPQRRKWSTRLNLNSSRSLAALFKVDAEKEENSNKGILATLFAGNFVGEQCLLPGQDKFQFSVRSMEWSDLLLLDLRDLVKEITSEEEMLYVRLAARFRSQRINALVDASLRLHQTSKPSKARNPDASAHSAAGSLLGGTSLLGGGGMLKLGLTRQASVDTTVGASGDDLIMRVGQLDLDLEAKEILQPLLMKSQASGTAPRWSELLAKSTVEAELISLQAVHGSLGLAQKATAPDMTETLMTLDALGTRDEEGRPSQEKIEDRLHAILRRLQTLESKTAGQLSLVQSGETAPEEAAVADASKDVDEQKGPEDKDRDKDKDKDKGGTSPTEQKGRYTTAAAKSGAQIPVLGAYSLDEEDADGDAQEPDWKGVDQIRPDELPPVEEVGSEDSLPGVPSSRAAGT